MSVYDDFEDLQTDKAYRRSINSLVKGKLYETYKFDSFQSQFPNKTTGIKPMSLVAYFKDEGMNFYSYLPGEFDNTPQNKIDVLNNDIAEKRPPSICFYGVLGINKNLVKIHQYGTAAKDTLLKTCNSIAATSTSTASSPSTAMKRKIEDETDKDATLKKKAL